MTGILASATLHEAAGRTGALPARLRPAYRDAYLAAPAFPVLCPVGDNLWLHRAVATARPGEVLVVAVTGADSSDAEEFGYWGEILSEAAAARGLAGLVIDGGVRDVRALKQVGLPVFSSSICIRGTIKDPDAPGSLGEPIVFGDVRVNRGDLVVADADGVVVIPADDRAAVLAAGREREAKEEAIIQRIRAGATTLDLYSLPAR